MEVSLSRYRKQRREINPTKVHWRLLSSAKDSTVFPQRDYLGILFKRPFHDSRIPHLGILRTRTRTGRNSSQTQGCQRTEPPARGATEAEALASGRRPHSRFINPVLGVFADSKAGASLTKQRSPTAALRGHPSLLTAHRSCSVKALMTS